MGSWNIDFQPFLVPIYNQNTSTILNSEIWNSRALVDTRVGRPFTQYNAIGVVSNAFGKPSGAIIQRGSNANGEFTLFADGTLLMHYYFTVGSGGTGVWLFPSTPSLVTSVTGLVNDSNAGFIINVYGVGNGGVTFAVRDVANNLVQKNVWVNAFARWF